MSEPHPTPRKPRRARRLVASAVIVAAVAGGAFAWQSRTVGNAAVEAQPRAARAIELSPLEVQAVAPRRLDEAVRLSGSVDPVNQAVVKSEVAAKLTEVRVREGQAVKRGEVLARFETTELSARLAEKESNLEGAKAQLALASKTREKSLALARKDIVSESALDQSQSAFQVQQAAVGALTAQVDLARKALRDATLTSPIDGIVSERLVNPGETLGTNVKMFSVVDLERVEVNATVPADEVARVRPGQPVRLRVDGFGDRVFHGQVARINPAALPGTRAIPVHVSLENRDMALRGGMFASGEVVVAEAAEAMAIPAAALRQDEAGSFVLVVGERRTERRAVDRVRAWNRGELVEVRGLAPGEIVVTGPLPGLKPGESVALQGS